MRKVLMILLVIAWALSACSTGLKGSALPTISVAAELTNTPESNPTITPMLITETPVTPQPALPVIAAPQLARFKMIDAQHGWGLAEKSIVRTDDGGLSWFDVTPSGVMDNIGYFAGSFFKDANTAWVAIPDQADPVNKGTLYFTTDGGVKWTSDAIPFGYGDIQFLDNNNGFAMISMSAGAGSVAIAIFQTTDGGSTWTRNFVNDPGIAGHTNSIPLGGYKDSIFFTDTMHGWVGGDVPAPAVIYLYATSDSGHTWMQQNLTLPAGHENDLTAMPAPVFFNSQDGVLPVTLVYNSQLLLYTTHDGGATWSASTTMLEGGSIYHINVFSPTEAVAFASGKFFTTQDAGHTWTSVTPATDYTNVIAVMDFIDLQHGWIIVGDGTGHRSLLSSNDGGATWNTLIP